jgi:hypothetical protein
VGIVVRYATCEAGERIDVTWRSLIGRVGLIRGGSMWYYYESI